MRKLVIGVIGATLIAASSTIQCKPLSPVLKAQLAVNLARGDLLYEYDQAAWHATDAMADAVPDTLKKLLRGFIVTPDGDNYRTTFYGVDQGREFAIYSATWTGKEIIRPNLFSSEPRPTRPT